MRQSPEIQVGVMSQSSLEFVLKGTYLIGGVAISGNLKADLVSGKIKLLDDAGKTIESDKEILLSPLKANSKFLLKNVTIGINFHWEQKENQLFEGALKIIIEEDKLIAINILSLDSYLISVISSEMSATSSLELLKAHAIISRSWLVAQIEKQNSLGQSDQSYISVSHTEYELIKWYDREDHSNYHVCADDHCQRYQGITRAQNPNVQKAVNETLGIILSYNDKVCDARFSKCCGGMTEKFENCWEPINHPYLNANFDNLRISDQYEKDLTVEQNAGKWILNEPEAFCNTKDTEVLKQVLNEYDWAANDFYRWKVEYSQQDLAKLIKDKSGIDFGEIINLTPIERGASGRLIKLKIMGTKRVLTVGKELEIRRWLSSSHLYSSAFIIETEDLLNNIPQKYILKGAGWGHGVGLCQIGAAMMAHKGYSYEKILQHYYRKTKLEKIYN